MTAAVITAETNVGCTGTRTLYESLPVSEYGTYGWVRSSVIINKKFFNNREDDNTKYHTSEHVTLIITTLDRRTKLHHFLQNGTFSFFLYYADGILPLCCTPYAH